MKDNSFFAIATANIKHGEKAYTVGVYVIDPKESTLRTKERLLSVLSAHLNPEAINPEYVLSRHDVTFMEYNLNFVGVTPHN